MEEAMMTNGWETRSEERQVSKPIRYEDNSKFRKIMSSSPHDVYVM